MEHTHSKKYTNKDGYKSIFDFTGQDVCIISGPCAVESEVMIDTIASKVKALGCNVLRGGAFKPRTSPDSFQGLGVDGLKYLHQAGKKHGLPVVSEIMEERYLEQAVKYLDIIQVGSRNMYNYPFLKAVGETGKPIILKRGMSATIEEWILASEYIRRTGNEKIIFCERGIRTYNTVTRNTLDLSAVTIVKERTGKPVIVDPSHGTGIRELVIPMARAALACYADGLMIEVHNKPDQALSDGQQSLTISDYDRLIQSISEISKMTF